jgi:hypothetical protein
MVGGCQHRSFAYHSLHPSIHPFQLLERGLALSAGLDMVTDLLSSAAFHLMIQVLREEERCWTGSVRAHSHAPNTPQFLQTRGKGVRGDEKSVNGPFLRSGWEPGNVFILGREFVTAFLQVLFFLTGPFD